VLSILSQPCRIDGTTLENQYQDKENEIVHMERNADIRENAEGLLRTDAEAEEQDGDFVRDITLT
jgi:hypothetical protein